MTQISLPPKLQDYQCEQETIGRSGSTVLKIRKTGQPVKFVKFSPLKKTNEIETEAERIEWLSSVKFKAPVVVDLFEHSEHIWLVTGALAGKNAVRCEDSPEKIVAEIANALRKLHSIKVHRCPFDESLDVKLDNAAKNVKYHRVDETEFDKVHLGRSASELLAEAKKMRPGYEDLVVTHGDASLPNFMIDSGKFSGVVDCSRLGVADRYQDIAIAARSIDDNFGEKLVPIFLESYGIYEADQARLSYYKLIDEFF